MALDSLLTVLAILAGIMIAAAGGIYLYIITSSGKPRFFASRRPRRLALIERTALDGGRRLLLIRRDGIEHLIMIGGPIDLVIETGIQPEAAVNGTAEEESFASPAMPFPGKASAWPHDHALSRAEVGLSLTPDIGNKEEDLLELTPLHEAKAVR
ncbi:MAG: flagellar biosynthetic protein FliO [Rhodomicrobium sp.]|nr:flagellar biosynthetic protein FliO [Rhodomicrobium sp.]